MGAGSKNSYLHYQKLLKMSALYYEVNVTQHLYKQNYYTVFGEKKIILEAFNNVFKRNSI